MNGNNGSPNNHLILLVLTLILGCLVLMLVRGGSNLLEEPAGNRSAAKQPLPSRPAPDVAEIETAPRHTAAIGLPRPQPSAPKTSAPPVVVATSRAEPEPPPSAPETVTAPFTGRLAAPPPAPPIGGIVTTRFTSGISGRVYLRGTPPPERMITLDATRGRLRPKGLKTRFYVVGEGSGLANVFVYIKEGAPLNFSIVNDQTPLLDQVGCSYEPYVMGVRTSQKFQIKNSDPIMHNVHATTKFGGGNKEFNFAQVTRGQVNEKSFAKAEVFVRVKRDIHPRMFAYIGVVEHPWFAVTDADGKFELPGKLPIGKYKLAAVHLKAGEQMQDLEPAGEAA